jgi:hypothetical protein
MENCTDTLAPGSLGFKLSNQNFEFRHFEMVWYLWLKLQLVSWAPEYSDEQLFFLRNLRWTTWKLDPKRNDIGARELANFLSKIGSIYHTNRIFCYSNQVRFFKWSVLSKTVNIVFNDFSITRWSTTLILPLRAEAGVTLPHRPHIMTPAASAPVFSNLLGPLPKPPMLATRLLRHRLSSAAAASSSPLTRSPLRVLAAAMSSSASSSSAPGGRKANRLATEHSPYLLQHAHNPVRGAFLLISPVTCCGWN